MPRHPARCLPALLLAGAASAQQFEPGVLAVTDVGLNALRLFDTSGALVEELQTEGSIGLVTGADFGPDGRLYLTHGNGAIYGVSRDGGFAAVIGQGTLVAPVDVTVGPGGELYVADVGTDSVLVFDASGQLLDEIGDGTLQDPTGVALFPTGDVLAVGNGGSNTVMRFTLAGQFVDELGAAAGIGEIGDLDWPRDAPIFVCDFSGDRVLALDGGGNVLFTLGDDGELDGPANATRGPDGWLWVTSRNTGELLVYAWDNTLLRRLDLAAAGSDDPHALAIAPHRFRARLKGPLGVEDQGAALHKELDATLVARPGRGTVWLRLSDDPEDAGDLASAFGASQLFFSGAEHELAGGKQRHWLGFHAGSGFAQEAPTLGLRWKAGTDAAGLPVLKAARGSLHLGADSDSVVAELRTLGLLK